jgi:hypothetical protein
MNLERALLKILNGRTGLMPVATLWSEAQLDEPQANYTAFKGAMNELQVKNQIVVIKGEDREKAGITDDGRARLAQ